MAVSMVVVSTVVVAVSMAVVSTVVVAGGMDLEVTLSIFLWFRALGRKQTFSNPVLTVVLASNILLSPVFLNPSAVLYCQ